MLLLLGILFLLLSFVDSFWTVLWMDRGGGPLSSRLSTGVWRGAVRLVGRERHGFLSIVGPALLLAILILWVVLLWIGWVLIFASGETALLSTRDQTPPNWVGRIYFVGYTLSTLGNGDFQPNGGVWQIMTALTTATGMITITLGASYLISVVGAVVSRRAFAEQVSSLGSSSGEVLRNAWNGRDLHALDLPLNSISSQISTLSQRYFAYPILRYYHADTASRSPSVALCMLDEALTLLRFGVPEEARPNPAVLHSVRSGVQSYLDTMNRARVEPAAETPPAPALAKLREHGIPTVSEQEFAHALAELSERRRILLRLVRNDGWDWPEP